MEVFLRNLPAHLTDQALETQLEAFTNLLGIKDWECQKFRKKPFGNITFLHFSEGQRFLQYYGRQSLVAGLGNSRLVIFGTPVDCQLSKRAPDAFQLKSLLKTAADRVQAKESNDSKPIQDEKVVFSTSSLSCGFYSYPSGELAYSPEVTWNTPTALAKFGQRSLTIEFDGGGGKNKIIIPYRVVEALVVSMRPPTHTLTLWETPRFFHAQTLDVVQQFFALSLNSTYTPTRSRLTALPNGSSDHQKVIGQAMVYQICASPASFEQSVRKLHERGILPIYQHNLSMTPSLRRSLAEDLAVFGTLVQSCSRMVPFKVIFQMEALVRNGYLLPWTVGELLKRMARPKLPPRNFPFSAEAIKKLFSQIPFPGLDVEASTFEPHELWQYIEDNEKELRTGLSKDLITEKGRQNLTMIHKVNVTPTGLTLHGPEPEAKNRILRRFPNFTDYFIRVQFCEEDGTDLRFNSNLSNDEIYRRFKHIFKDGISVGGRVYGFLGFSHSSLRSHAAWFMAPFFHDNKLQSYFSIISYLGKFDKIFSPARCAARIGQAFSETPVAVSMEHIELDVIPDIESPDGRRVFSDGVGKISRSVMEAIQAVVPSRKLADGSTCFQIRWGGAKGMLALDTRLEGSKMHVRPSMIKFESTDDANLEICDMARKPIPMVLNRQMIRILEDMGIPHSWFMQQQARELYNLQLITANVVNTVGFLKRQSVADGIGLPRLIRRLDYMKIDYRKDRFLASVVEAAILRELRLLKHKARIPIPHGVTLFGIVDETGYLNEGEVYLAFDDAVFISDRYLDLDNRRMIVTRSPALHPGDIQIATNIVPPAHHPLRSLRNCIVFSQKGARDLPSCLSGGDLDGDIYGIIWDQDAVRQCEWTFQPADYPRVAPLNIGRVVEREDMTDFFITFMATDQLGLIATRHMILADQKDAGTLDQDCLTLAEMHSTSVDYSKTGIPVDMSKFRNIKMNRYRPDFLAPAPLTDIKERHEISFDTRHALPANDNDDEDDSTGPRFQYYYSEKINGKLYRAIDERKIWFEDIKIKVPNYANIWDNFLEHVNRECDRLIGGVRWAKHEKEAIQIRSAYEDAIWNATVDYSDHAFHRITELEVFTGTLFNKSGTQTRRQRDKSLQLKDEFERIAHWAEAMIRKRKMRTAGDGQQEGFALGSDEALALSVACLIVGCMKQPKKSRRSRNEEETFESFKVVAACCVIKELDGAKRRMQMPPSIAV